MRPVRMVAPTPERVELVARNLRASDCAEVYAAEGRSGYEGAMAAWRDSDICYAIIGDRGNAVGLCGINGHYIWMLGTDELTATESHRRQLTLGARRWITSVVEHKVKTTGQALLHNWVHAKNIDSIRWLESLGFTVHPPEPHGPSLQLFCYFCMRA